ncbi:hypothetical protein HPP92_013159 [Vanilla planifolia]|uniref:Uncharacterized protein n=1 Tax=Vanilla planifolia TaxID=51239 RepID=A0A835UWE2_VANPL|nr:hypothetical protein HPP92_013159 [Vanilla planifolia]
MGSSLICMRISGDIDEHFVHCLQAFKGKWSRLIEEIPAEDPHRRSPQKERRDEEKVSNLRFSLLIKKKHSKGMQIEDH